MTTGWPRRFRTSLETRWTTRREVRPSRSTRAIHARGEGDTVFIEITNQGICIPADVLPAIFTAFRRVESHATVNSGHLGLGLYIASEIVRSHGGVLSVRPPTERRRSRCGCRGRPSSRAPVRAEGRGRGRGRDGLSNVRLSAWASRPRCGQSRSASARRDLHALCTRTGFLGFIRHASSSP